MQGKIPISCTEVTYNVIGKKNLFHKVSPVLCFVFLLWPFVSNPWAQGSPRVWLWSAPAVVVYVKHTDPDSRRICSITASTQPGTTIRCLHKFVPSTFSEILWRQVFSLEGACLVVSSGEMLELGDREAWNTHYCAEWVVEELEGGLDITVSVAEALWRCSRGKSQTSSRSRIGEARSYWFLSTKILPGSSYFSTSRQRLVGFKTLEQENYEICLKVKVITTCQSWHPFRPKLFTETPADRLTSQLRSRPSEDLHVVLLQKL